MSFSLQNSIRTCKVDTGWASRLQSDRFLNPNNTLCIAWNGYDNLGRKVSPDTFTTKRAGCNSSEDRIMVENSLRPSYTSYVTLDAQGINGDNMYEEESWDRVKSMRDINNISGNFGLQFGAYNNVPCGVDSRGCSAQRSRHNQMVQQGYQSHQHKQFGSCGHY